VNEYCVLHNKHRFEKIIHASFDELKREIDLLLSLYEYKNNAIG
jgi:hypothetical protein